MCELHISSERYIPVDVRVKFGIDTPIPDMTRVGVVQDSSTLLRSLAFLADKDYENMSRGERQDYVLEKRKLLPKQHTLSIFEEDNYRVNIGIDSIGVFLDHYSVNVALFAEVEEKLALVDFFETDERVNTVAIYKLNDYMFNPILVADCTCFEADIALFCCD